ERDRTARAAPVPDRDERRPARRTRAEVVMRQAVAAHEAIGWKEVRGRDAAPTHEETHDGSLEEAGTTGQLRVLYTGAGASPNSSSEISSRKSTSIVFHSPHCVQRGAQSARVSRHARHRYSSWTSSISLMTRRYSDEASRQFRRRSWMRPRR